MGSHKMLLFHAKTILRDSCSIELGCLKKKGKEEEDRKTFFLFHKFLVWYFHDAFFCH